LPGEPGEPGQDGSPGAPGQPGQTGAAGNAPFPVTAATSAAPAGSRANDLVINTATTPVNIGNLTNVAIGGVTRINTTSPFALANVGSIRGQPGPNSDAGLHSARPAANAVAQGTLWFSTDHLGGTLFRSDGTNWQQVGPSAQQYGGARLGFAELAADFSDSGLSAQTDVPGMQLTVNVGARPIKLAIQGSFSIENTAKLPGCQVLEGSDRIINANPGSAERGGLGTFYFAAWRWITPTPGNHTYRMVVQAQSAPSIQLMRGPVLTLIFPWQFEITEG
jgi:hypothetical protein